MLVSCYSVSLTPLEHKKTIIFFGFLFVSRVALRGQIQMRLVKLRVNLENR